MKKYVTVVIAATLTAYMAVSASAKIGDAGYFGGVSVGTALPKTIETTLSTSSKSKSNARTMEYKEVIFLTGKPIEFIGNITVTTGITDKDSGTYKETYSVVPSKYTTEGAKITRKVVFDVSYEKVSSVDSPGGYQIVKNSKVSAWTETVTIGDKAYTLERNKSYFSKTSNEDISGGVTYIKSNISSRSVYYITDTEGETITQTNTGESYGYNQAWSSTETSRINTTIDYKSGANTWQLQAQLRPSVTVNKVLQYSPNEPSITSFNGNYYEVLQKQNGLQYDITVLPQQFSRDTATSGSITIDTYNDIEALRVPSALNLIALKGNGAEEDIKQLYSMGVFDNPQYFNPSQGMTRAQFVTALVKAIKLPIETTVTTTSKSKTKTETIEYLFQDLSSDRAEYKYIKAAYDAGITVGRHNGRFRPDELITKEEAYCIMLRGLGVQNMAYTTAPLTPFTDNSSISLWARNELNYMNTLGLIDADEDGKINPRKNLSKGEAAALINNFVKYMRQKMQIDYIENIVYYTK